MSITDIIGRAKSTTANAELSKFTGTVDLNAASTNFIANMNMALGVNVGGKINISPKDVSATAKAYGISTETAQTEIAIHELGHEYYAAKDALNYQSTAAGREAWCYNREGESSYFGFLVAVEAQANGVQLGVLGPSSQPNLLSSMLSFSQTLSGNPQSLTYQLSMISFAKNVYANDPQYQAFCKVWAADPTKATPALFIPPEDTRPPYNDAGSGGGGSGGGSTGGGSGGTSPIGGGYWNPLPVETNPESSPISPLKQPYADGHGDFSDFAAHLIGGGQPEYQII